MITANLSEAKSLLVTLVRAVEEEGETVILCRDGVEVAEIRPLPQKKHLPLHLPRNLVPSPSLAVSYSPGYDPTEALTEDEWPAAGR